MRSSQLASDAEAFFHRVVEKIQNVLTDSGQSSTDRFSSDEERKPTGQHPFDQAYAEYPVKHRLIQSGLSQTNAMVERFHGRISDVLATRRYVSGEGLEQTPKRYCWRVPSSHPAEEVESPGHNFCDESWRNKRPEILTKRVINYPGTGQLGKVLILVMNNFKEKALEEVGVLSKNRLRLSSFSQKHIFDVKKGLHIIKAPDFICVRDKGCLVLAESWFRERGIYLSWGTLGGVVLLGFFLYIALILPWTLERDTEVLDVLIPLLMLPLGLLFSSPLLFAAKSELKTQGLQYTIFNQRSKNIHFVSDVDFNTRTCHWNECTFCLAYSAGGVEGNYYELKGYLFNQDGSVRDSFSFDDYHYMPTNSDTARQAMIDDLTARFEYIRRFMEEGAEAEEPVRGALDLTPTLSEAAHRFQPRSKPSDGKSVHIIYSIVRILFLIPFSVQVVGHYVFCRYCRLPTWPQSVIDECGEDIFPKR